MFYPDSYGNNDPSSLRLTPGGPFLGGPQQAGETKTQTLPRPRRKCQNMDDQKESKIKLPKISWEFMMYLSQVTMNIIMFGVP